MIRTSLCGVGLGAGLLLLISANATYAGVISYWSFDENGGTTALDNGPGGNDGTIVNATYVAGKVGASALSFNNTNTHVALGAPANLSLDYNQPFSISAWINGPAGQGAILGKLLNASPYTGYELNVTHSSNVHGPNRANLWMINAWETPALQVDSSIVVLDSTWHHLVVTSDGTGTGAGVKFYIDGILDAAATASKNTLAGNSILSASTATIGARNAVNDVQVFGGTIDEVAIYDLALSAEQAQLLASESATPVSLFIAPVPEPSSILLLGFGTLGLLRRRRLSE